MRRYIVAVKDAEMFVFDNEQNMKGFVDDLHKRFPRVQLAISVVGDDEMEARAS